MRAMIPRAVLFALVSFFIALPSLEAQTVSGTITSDTSWTTAVEVTGSVTILSGKTLTIQPGVVVSFDPGTALFVAGKILAGGTSGSPITFTSHAGSPLPGDWNGIEFQNTANVGSVFSYCVVQYAGGGTDAAGIFYITGAYSINISNCTFQRNANNGINTRASSPRISSSTFNHNAGFGVYSDLLSNFIIDSCTVTNNTVGGIRVSVNASSAQITNSVVDTNGIGIFIDNNAFPTVTNNKIRKNATGIQFTGVGSTQPTITGNMIASNTVWGFLNTNLVTTVKAERNYWGSDLGPYNATMNPTGLGNAVSAFVDFQPWSPASAIPLPVVTVSSNIVSNTLWLAGSVYRVTTSISVTSGTLTIAPGSIVKFNAGARLTVNGGALNANGKPDSLIVFTSYKDDGYGGDSNGDSTATAPSPGDWDMIYLPSSAPSVLNNVVLKFGGSAGDGNLYVYSTNPTLSNVYSTNSSNYGMLLYYSASNIVNSIFSGNAYRAMDIYNSTSTLTNVTASGNGNIGIFGEGTSQLTLHRCTVNNNGSTGIYVDGGGNHATIVLLDSCVIANNNGNGLYNYDAFGPQTFSNSIFSGNNGVGLWCLNLNSTISVTSDSLRNNTGEGIGVSSAVITNNVITGNRYPISLIGRVNSTYSGNTISGNQYNNVMALRMNRGDESFSDTLKTTVPAGMSPGTYVLVENSVGTAVQSGQTFVIQPGVILKMASGLYMNLYGTFIANGTAANPIVFTSYRDASYGGKTTLVSDTNRAAPNDWRYLRIIGSAAVNSVVRNCILKYGGVDGDGNLWIDGASLVTPIDSIICRKSGNIGIQVDNCIMTFTNSTIDSNGTYGFYLYGSSPRADVTVRTSYIQYNGNMGMLADNSSAFRELSNNIITHNNSNGVGVNNGTIPQVFNGNTITFNNGHGIYNESPSFGDTAVSYIGNTITDNLYEGIFSTAARFVDNHINRNRYPIGVWGRLGNIYTDNQGVDGNTFSGNQFNNAIALAGQSYAPLQDTLKNLFPVQITSHTYVAVENIQVTNGYTMVIQPGVNIKFQLFPPSYNSYVQFNVYGTLIANGTPVSPIVFTSWRDSTFGGKTAAPGDFGLPAPGDWYFVALRNGSAPSNIQHCQFRFGGRDGQQEVYAESNLSGLVFSNNTVRKSLASGIFVSSTIFEIDSTTVDSCNGNGLYVNDNATNNVSLRYSRLANNAGYGIYSPGNGRMSVVTNCTVVNNGATGIYIANNNIPLSIIGNTVSNNAAHGIYVLARNDGFDTVMTISGNKVRNNVLAGIVSSRAFIVDDSVTGNRYALGVTGQISLDGTTTAAGNVYEGGFYGGNKFPGVIMTEGNVFGRMGLSYPAGFTSKVYAVRGDLDVPSGTMLTIAPGTVVKFPHEYGNARFQVDGVLKSEGTNSNKIVFTSWKDDSYGGDSNADTTVTVPGGGDWDMVYLNGASNNSSHLLQTIVRYGGSTNNGDFQENANNAPVDSSFFSYSSNYGIYLNSSSPAITGSEIHHNAQGITTGGSSNPVIHFNNFHDNSQYGLNNTTSNTINATQNYWGDPTGPFVNQGAPQNLTGLGNRVGINPGEVNYQSWLATRNGALLGDVSGNGTISAFDASLILQYLVSSITLNGTQLVAADVTGDGTVSALDASYILRYVIGVVTGFPGLGKHADASAFANAYQISVEPGQDDHQFAVVLKLNGTVPVYGAEMALDFDKNELSAVSMVKSTLSDSLTAFSNLSGGSAAVAFAGVQPASGEGEFVRIVFQSQHEIKGTWTSQVRVTRLVLNEASLISTPTSLEISATALKGIPTTFGLSQNYPNPFNPSTTIEYQIPVSGGVSIRIYDLLGREVRTLVDRQQSAGYFAVVWDGNNGGNQPVASGVYLCRIQVISGDKQAFTAIRKMVLLK